MKNLKTFESFSKKELLEKTYKGRRIELISMQDQYTDLKPGDQGECVFVDDSPQLHMKWDNGSSLALIPGVDKFKIVD
jgi:hypothetical protein